jgi:hypothetical protein
VSYELAKKNDDPEEYKKYLKNGCFMFQVDFDLELLNYDIENKWTDLDKPRPQWIRQNECVPSGCGKCVFCLRGLTTGVGHKGKHRARIAFM